LQKKETMSINNISTISINYTTTGPVVAQRGIEV
jgi:hypothetical protein